MDSIHRKRRTSSAEPVPSKPSTPVVSGNGPDLIRTSEAARILRRSPRTVQRAANKGYLKYTQLGDSMWLFFRDEVEAMARRIGVLA